MTNAHLSSHGHGGGIVSLSYHCCTHDSSTETARSRTSTNRESCPSCMRMSSPSALIHAVNCTRAARSTGGAHAPLPPPGSAQGDAAELNCAALACTLSPRTLPKEVRASPTAPLKVNAFAGSIACEDTALLYKDETSEHIACDGATHVQHAMCGTCGTRIATSVAVACRVPRVMRGVIRSTACDAPVVTYQV